MSKQEIIKLTQEQIKSAIYRYVMDMPNVSFDAAIESIDLSSAYVEARVVVKRKASGSAPKDHG